MQNCVQYLPRKSFNTFGVVLLTLFACFAVVVIGISASFSFDTSFHCHDETISKTKEAALINDINIKCSLKYQEKFRTHLTFGLLILNFGVVLSLSVIFGYLIKHRVEKFAGTETSNNENAENEPTVTPLHPGQNDVRECFPSFPTIFIYVFHLIVARIAPLLIFATIFYLSNIPTNFSCPWGPDVEQTNSPNSNVSLNSGYNLTFVGCTNPVGGKSKSLFDFVATVDVVVVVLTFLELGYLAWLAICDRDFMTDQEFCEVYLLRKRKRIRKIVNRVRERLIPYNHEVFELTDNFGDSENSSRTLDDIYVNVDIQEKRKTMDAYPKEFDTHGIYKSNLKAPKTVTKLTSSAEMFKPKKDDKDQKYPKTILVIGRPGIGKTMLTKKLLQQYEKNDDEFWTEKIVLLLQLRKCNNENVTLRRMLGYSEGLSRDAFDRVYNSILLIPAKTVLIFDGLDELDVDSSLLRAQVNAGQSPDEEVPAFIILKQLFCGNFLPGATILITSQPTAWQVLQCFNFDRKVEILGFFEKQIKEYVFKFCKYDNDAAKRIWNPIQESTELLSLCYIPFNSYIVCLTLKESIKDDETRDIPKTVTELYKRAVKVSIYRHHPRLKLQPRPSDYLFISFPPDLENEFSRLKQVAINGIGEGKLIFERTTRDDFGDLANFGLFHKLPDRRRNYFCFVHSTLQEFLAALNVVDDMDNVEEFLDTHIDLYYKWGLVIQFVAGLVGDKIKEAAEMQNNEIVMKKWRGILADIQERLESWVFMLGNGIPQETNIALLAIKWLHELQDSDTMKSVCSKFLAGGNGELRLIGLNITPADSAALFEFLGNSKNLKRLDFYRCVLRGNYSYKKMQKSLLNNPSNSIISLKWKDNFSTDPGLIVCLSEALKHENCKLTSLYLSGNEITEQGVKYLSEALKSENCKLTSLDLNGNEITDQGVEYLSKALKSGNCKLTSLDLSRNRITDQGVEYLSKALKSGNCKLTSLDLSRNRITDQGVEYLSEALKSGNCKLTSLNLSRNRITYQGVEYLTEALKSGNCKLTSLDLNGNEITDQGVKYLTEALKSENCKLTSLDIDGDGLTDQIVEDFSEALNRKYIL